MKAGSLFLFVALFAMVSRGSEIDFNRDIRPIISENCVHCHGPDAEAREGDLRLDRGGHNAVVPHSLEESDLWLRVDLDSSDPDVMPPTKSKRKLSAEQKALLKRWIESGGKYDEHWAFVAPEKAVVPETASSAIDYFVAKKLREIGLQPSPKAPSATLIRRASLDLTGLPPTPEDVTLFQKAYQVNPKQALEQLIDRLLASSRFGERWARQWLDLARYADSNGFQADQIRDSWAYRDWVIESLNTNMPYDQFTIEQLAGDLLPEPTLKNRIATGFHRTVTCNVEAGVHPEENRTNQVVDRVNTTGTVWMGVTMECAQCHDHKYDPFSMADYYQLFAFFNNTPLEVSKPTSINDVSHDFVGPFMDLPQSDERKAKRIEVANQLKELDREKKILGAKEKFNEWMRETCRQVDDKPEWSAVDIAGFSTTGKETFEIFDDQSVLLSGEIPRTTTYTVAAKVDIDRIYGIKLEALTHERLPGKGPGRGDPVRTNFVLTDFQFLVDGVPVNLVNATADFSQGGWDVSGAVDSDKTATGWAIAPEFGKDHWATFQTETPIELKPDSKLTFVLDQQYRGGRTIGCFRISVIDQIPRIEEISPGMLTLLKKPKHTASELKKIREYFESSDPQMAALQKKRKKVAVTLEKLKPDQTLVMEELEEARMTNIMMRGNYLSKSDPVVAATPAFFSPMSKDQPRNRLGLAKWLVSRENPLVARVAVNRWWAEIFGRGIVATQEDFGTQSEPPTHPELLDWLAVEFMDSGWDMKHLLKKILLSETWQQSAVVTGKEIDPANHYLSRAPRFRFDAERIRDNALAVSGLLSIKMYGPPIMPYQPDNIWRQVGRNEPKWIEAKDENRWRRGIYIVYRRAAPYPSMVNFDAPDRGACTVSRARTNTPLQALTLLNDPAYVEMALAFADRVLTESKSADFEERLETAWQLAFSRSATTMEVAHLRTVFEERYLHFSSNPKSAREILKSVTSVYKAKHKNEAELAAWFYIGNIVLNLDEMITKS